ncbi:MAG: DUF348 domain-containing protein [Anaerolineales bacterium]|nr:DUF348 domain-containing protein [Anaerolineales bacterium]
MANVRFRAGEALPAGRGRLSALLPWLSILIGLAALAHLWLHKEVRLVVDGKSQAVTTYALTVGGLLGSRQIALLPQDILSPEVEEWLGQGDTVSLQHAMPVRIAVDGQISSLLSAQQTAGELLALAGITLQPGDRLLWQGQAVGYNQPLPYLPGGLALQVVRAAPFTLIENGIETSYTSSAATLGQALWENGVILYAADRLSPSPLTALTTGMEATLERAREVRVQTQNTSLQLRTASQTVGEALAEAGLALQGLDYSIPPAGDPLPADGNIRLVRVMEEVLIEQTPLAFETVYEAVADLELDSQTIVQTGEYGLTARRVRLRYEDGVETSRQVEDEWTAREAQERIIGYGTNVVMRTASVDGVTIEYWRAITMWATSYHPSETGPTTASGLPLEKGVCAVDIRYIPFYTRMYVPGYGEVVAADIGGGVVGRMIDLGYSDGDYVPWHENVTVYFLWPPPASIVYIFP